MPSFRTAVVQEILLTRRGLQRMRVSIDGESSQAYALTDTVGPITAGDRVIVNTTAIELGLGTGGWHVVHWNLGIDELVHPGPGHIMKARYTSVQMDVGSAEDQHAPALQDFTAVGPMPVAVAVLHSQVAAIAAAARSVAPEACIVYVMSDGAALPIAISDLVTDLDALGWINSTITAGNAFGGTHEAVNVWSALAIARNVAHADLVVVAPGPGVVGTATPLGTSSIDMGGQLDAAGTLGGQAIATVRASNADVRARHRGISHHFVTAMTLIAQRRCTVPLAADSAGAGLRAECEAAGIAAKHDIVAVDVPDIIELFDRSGLSVSSMGRPATEDRMLFDCAAAAGAWAAQQLL